LGQLGESVTAFEKATEIASWISERDPADRKAWFDLVAAEMRTAASLLEEPQGAGEALRFLMKAEVPLTRLLNEDPSNQRFRMYALILDCHQGKALMLLGRYAEATRRLEKARSHAVNFRGGPNEKNAWSWGIGAALRLAQIKAETGDRAGSVALADEVASGLTKVAPQALGNAWSGALFYMRLGSLYLKIGQGRSASLWLEKAAVTWRGMTVPAALEEQRRRALAATERDLHR
jgi:tetratricopeptide (TPR) repeat protein